MKRFLVFAGSFEPFRSAETAFLGGCDDLPTARMVACEQSSADWYLIYDRTSRQLTCHQREQDVESLHSFKRSLS